MGRQEPWRFIIYGETASKANSRQIVFRGGKVRSIKSEKALSFSDQFKQQCPILDPMFEGDVMMLIDIYYASRRPDLDESLVLDLLQGCVYKNDRQVKSRVARWGLSPTNPRVDIMVRRCMPEDYAGVARTYL